MKSKYAYILLSLLVVTGAILSCSKIQQAKDAFSAPSAREIYAREFEKNSPELELWEAELKNAVLDSVLISLPYAETGKFTPESFPVYSYEFTLDEGEQLVARVETDSLDALVFIDLFRKESDSLRSFRLLESAEYGSRQLAAEVGEPGVYKILVQPEIKANTGFKLKMSKEPAYEFPVASKGNAAIQSFWGASRDAGKRRHEGIDIFAARGTPVVAATAGRVSSTGNKGLGGKQVWLRDAKRGNSLYYAHLDSIIATPGMRVEPGDTLGLVGNSGNARTTAPHLHFGIYRGYGGARNPLPYVFRPENPGEIPFSEAATAGYVLSTATANLRKGPTTKAEIKTTIKPQDTLKLLGKTGQWFHARFQDENIFIHQSLATPL